MAVLKWCKACGAENNVDASYCKACGEYLGDFAAGNAWQDGSVQMRGFANRDVSQLGGSQSQPTIQQQSSGFQNQVKQNQFQFQQKPGLRPENGAMLGFTAFLSIVALLIGVGLFFFGQQQIDTYSGFPWYEPYESKVRMGSLLRIIGGVACLGGIVGLLRYFMMRK